MTFSSQAGLASIRAGVMSHASEAGFTNHTPVNRELPNIIIRTESSVAFELRHVPKMDDRGRWVVIASVGRQSITAEAMVGMEFTQGGNPNWWSQGYAQIIQRKLNQNQGEPS